MQIETVTAPQAPFGIDRVKRHLNIDHDDDDLIIGAYLVAAVEFLDGWSGILGRAVLAQDLRIALDGFPAGDICLPVGPVTSVVSITYRDAGGATVTVDPATYILDAREPAVIPRASWPATDGTPLSVAVTWTAGPAVCPAPIEVAILMLAAHFFETRKGDGEIPETVNALIAPYRRETV